MWTVLIGENGTGKTSVLQAIAMAAAGSSLVNTLARRVTSQLLDRRQDDRMLVEARFAFQPLPPGASREYPGLEPREGIELVSRVQVGKDEFTLTADAKYADDPGEGDPLVAARSRNLHLWFVAGYGVARVLPDAGMRPLLDQVAIDRMQTLFDSSVALTSTAFANYFDEDRAREFAAVLKKVLLHSEQLVPNITDLDLRGRGGVKHAGSLQETARITQKLGAASIKLPATALSHGYQSTIAWIADLVGHIVLEAQGPIEASEMQGLVLVDELDLYLHPVWQVGLVSALRETFPQLQFVATTHSPLVTASLAPNEIVRLEIDEASGHVRRRQIDQDPRVLTGTEVYREFFDVDEIYPNLGGRQLAEYRYLAANPYRSGADDTQIEALRQELDGLGIDPKFAPVEKKRG